ncbi:hypothetical protein [Amycolatopsis sp. NPDC051128]|uniref:hypothetical protein n=1 Tax=Amycolatopsis sp. NPDC051128 TaxID=3155412 RepID=UPI003424FC83
MTEHGSGTRAGRHTREIPLAADPDIRTNDSVPRQTAGNVRVSHSSHDGAIAVVVSLDGHVLDLRLTPAATQRPADQLAHDILDCIHAAQGLFPTPGT